MNLLNKGKRCPYIVLYFFFWMSYNIVMPYIGLFFQEKGLSENAIGNLVGMGYLMCVISALAGSYFEDRFGKPGKIIQICSFGMIVTTTMMYKTDMKGLIVIFYILFKLFESPINGITDRSLMIEITDHPETFARYRSMGTAGAAVGIILVAFILEKYGFRVVFLAFAILMVPCMISAAFFKESNKDEIVLSKKKIIYNNYYYAEVIKNKNFFPIYGALSIWGFAECGCGVFMPLIIKEAGLHPTNTSSFVVLTMIGEFFSFLLIPMLMKRISKRMLFVIGLILQALRMLSLGFIGKLPILLVMVLQFIGGTSFAIISSVSTVTIDRIYNEDVLYTAHLFKNLTEIGIGMTVGSIFLGIMFNRGLGIVSYIVISASCVMMALYLLSNRKLELDQVF